MLFGKRYVRIITLANECDALHREVIVHPCPCFDGHNDRTFKPGFFKYFALQPIGE